MMRMLASWKAQSQLKPDTSALHLSEAGTLFANEGNSAQEVRRIKGGTAPGGS